MNDLKVNVTWPCFEKSESDLTKGQNGLSDHFPHNVVTPTSPSVWSKFG